MNEKNVTQNGSGKDGDQWKRWWRDRGFDLVLRGVSLVLVLFVVMLFVCKLYTYQPECGKNEALALIAWKDFLLGAVVVAFIWLVRSLWE